MGRKNKLGILNLNLIILVLIVVAFLVFASYSVKKPIVLDEIINMNQIASISRGGVPIGYWGEDLTYSVANLHPPLVFYILAIGYKAFNSEIGPKLITIIFCAGAIIIIYLISKYIFRRKKNVEKIALISSFLFALSPLIVQVSTIVTLDIVLLFFILLFVYLFITSHEDKLFSFKTWILILLVAIIFWCKFANVPVLFLTFFLYWIIGKKSLRFFFKFFIVFLLGAMFFGVTWYFYTKSIGMPFLNFLVSNANYARGSRLFSVFTINGFLLRIWTIKNIMFWTTPYFMILVIFALVNRVKEFMKEKKNDFLNLFIIFSFSIALQYFVLYPSSYGFPKHFVAMVPGFSMLIAYYISKFKLKDLVEKKKLLSILLIAVTLVTIFNFVFLKDPFIEHNIFYTKSITLENNFNEYLISNIKGILFFIPFVIIFLIFYPFFIKKKYKTYHIVIFSMFITVITSMIYIDYVQAKADYSTKWGYGESGILEASNYIKEHTSKNDIIISRGCIGYYADRRYYMSYPDPNPGIRTQMRSTDVGLVDYPNNINQLIKNRAVQYVVLSNLEKGIYPEPQYHPIAKYGSFTIYKSNHDLQG